jgi:hypothetical protein
MPMAHTCNPSYLGDWDWEDQDSRPALAKSLQDSISSNSWGWWCVPVIPATARNIKEDDHGRGPTGQKARPYIQCNQSRKSWKCSLSSRKQAESPKLKSQYHQK